MSYCQHPDPQNLIAAAKLPYGLKPAHVLAAMRDFTSFLELINTELGRRSLLTLESMLMPANFSSMVGEFVGHAMTTHCTTLVRNRYHNGHPDLLPVGQYAGDAAQHVSDGIEIKASRYSTGWQGHNPERVFLMVFVFQSGRRSDADRQPFRFTQVLAAQLQKRDWTYAGRNAGSRRTPTASVNKRGLEKMQANIVYSAS